MRPIQRSQTIFVTMPTNTSVGTKVFLPDIPELRDALVDGIEAYTDNELAADLQGQPVVSIAGMQSLVVNLIQESDRRAQDFPLQSLLATAYGGIFKEFTGWRLNWQKCYVQAVSAAAADQVVALNIFYHYGTR